MEYEFVISGQIGVAFDWWTGQRGTTAKMVRDFLDPHNGEDVDMAVSSPGGYVDHGLEIYQLVKDHGKVHMHILGMTASAATFLTMGAKSVDMVDGSLMLIHNSSTAVMEWQQANKEQLDALIAKYQKERDDLNTIDKVIASLYAKRNGKTVEECMKKMEKAAWLSPKDALEFGLIDNIREDDDAARKANSIRSHFTNNIFKEFGLPPFPTAAADEVVDEKGNPTKSFIQKSVEAVKAIFSNNPANSVKNMIKIFKNIMDLLNVKDGFNPAEDGSISLTQDQIKTVDDRLGSLQKDLDAANTAKDDLQKQLDKANADLAAANEKLNNLSKSPGEQTQGKPADTENEEESLSFIDKARKMYNTVKDL